MTTINRPGNMETIYEKRENTNLFGKIIKYEDKYRTLEISLSDGTVLTMTWSTFKSAWRIKKDDEEEPKMNPEEIVCTTNEAMTIPVNEKPERKRGALITWNGKAQNICTWGKELGISPNTLYARIYTMNWSIEKAFTTNKGAH